MNIGCNADQWQALSRQLRVLLADTKDTAAVAKEAIPQIEFWQLTGRWFWKHVADSNVHREKPVSFWSQSAVAITKAVAAQQDGGCGCGAGECQECRTERVVQKQLCKRLDDGTIQCTDRASGHSVLFDSEAGLKAWLGRGVFESPVVRRG